MLCSVYDSLVLLLLLLPLPLLLLLLWPSCVIDPHPVNERRTALHAMTTTKNNSRLWYIIWPSSTHTHHNIDLSTCIMHQAIGVCRQTPPSTVSTIFPFSPERVKADGLTRFCRRCRCLIIRLTARRPGGVSGYPRAWYRSVS